MLANRLLGVRVPAVLSIAAATVLLAFVISQETPTGALRGRVVAQESGNPIKASVFLTPAVQKDGEPGRYYRKCQSDGAFSFARIPAGEYKLEVSGRVHSMEPTRVTIDEGRTQTVEVELAPGDATLEMYIHQHIFTPGERPQITCHGFTESDAIAVGVYKVDLDSFLTQFGGSLQRLLGMRSYYGDSGTAPRTSLESISALTRAELMSARITARDSEGVYTQRIDLPELAPGLYVVAANAGDRQALGWVMVTGLGLVTKSSGNGMLAYAVDLKTGEPAPGAEVQVRSGPGEVVSGKTDASGLLEMKLPTRERGGSENTIVARSGESFAFVSTWTGGMRESADVVYAYTDRPVYRPGQKVFFKGIVRRFESESYKARAGRPVSVEVRDPRDTLVHRATLRTDEFGSYSGELDLNREASTGYYSVVTSVDGEERGEGTGFRVTAYRKPEFSVKVTYRQKRYTRGEIIKARVRAEYYFGAPVANAKVNYYVTRSPYWLFGMDEEENYGGYEDHGYYGESVLDGEVTTNARGEAEIEFPADWPQPDQLDGWDTDQQFDIEVYVTDKSRQEANGSGSVLATRGEFAIDVTPDVYVIEPGGTVAAAILVQDYDRRPVKRRSVTIAMGMDRWTASGENEFKVLEERRIVTDDRGRASVRIEAKRAGSMRIVARCRDSRRNNITGAAYVWCYGGAGAEMGGARHADLQIVTDKKTYNPGDTAKILINTRQPGATALVTVEGDRIYDRKTVRLDGLSTAVEMPIGDAYKPNFYVGVCFVRNKSFVSQQARAKVSLRREALRVKVEPDKRSYRPGEEAVYRISATDSAGNPARAQLSVGVVDEAIYAIARDHTQPILDYFYSRKPNGVQTSFSFPRIYLSDPDKAGSPRMKAGGREIRIRKRFLDTAFWQANVLTDPIGEAMVRFRLPDNLTTWRATVRGITRDTACGEARRTVIAQQDLMVRLETPRFLVQTDDTTITAVVHNHTGRAQNVDIDFRAPGLAMEGKARRRVSVANGGSEAIDWTVRAPKPGSFAVTVTAAAGQYGDAMRLDLPVYPHGEERQVIRQGTLSGTHRAAMNIEVRRDSIPEATRLKVSLAPSLAAAMLGSLQYLAQYPYGCTEQTVSSFLPDVVLARSLGDLGVRNAKLEAELPDMVSTGLFRLYRFQLDDGGWSWCEYGEADPWMTAYVCYALLRAKEAGFPVNQRILDGGLNKLNDMAGTAKMDASTRCYCCYVLAMGGWDVSERMANLAQSRNIDNRSLAALTLAFLRAGSPDQGRTMLERLFSRAIAEPESIHWESHGYYSGADIETTAMALEAALKFDPKDTRIPGMVRWLMRERRDCYWNSTRDTAMVLYAMSEYLKTSGELAPDYTARVSVNGRQVASIRFGRESAFQPDAEVIIPAGHLRKGRNLLEITREGSGNLYFDAKLTQFIARKTMPITMTGAGISVTRSYFKPPTRFYEGGSRPDPGRQVSGCRSGEVILVRLTVNSSRRLKHLMLEDFIPAGCEIIDKGQLSYWEWDYWYVGRDIRDERISFYLDDLRPGRHVVDYKMRAGFPGTFHAMPAQVFAMYEPRVRAATAEGEFTIR